jgi:hypothetical protein
MIWRNVLLFFAASNAIVQAHAQPPAEQNQTQQSTDLRAQESDKEYVYCEEGGLVQPYEWFVSAIFSVERGMSQSDLDTAFGKFILDNYRDELKPNDSAATCAIFDSRNDAESQYQHNRNWAKLRNALIETEWKYPAQEQNSTLGAAVTANTDENLQASGRRTTSSGIYVAHKVGANCTSSACAVRIKLAVYLPLGAKIHAIGCYTVAGQTDSPHGRLRRVSCGVDTWWSVFTTPVQQSTPHNVVVTSEFQNRSSDRDRDCRLDVEWEP